MAGYKLPCMACGGFIDSASNVCPMCGKNDPFVDRCPNCMHEIQKAWQKCPDCGRDLYIACPFCSSKTFVYDKCEVCGKKMQIQCQNKRCMALQFFQNPNCTKCGKKLKNREFVG